MNVWISFAVDNSGDDADLTTVGVFNTEEEAIEAANHAIEALTRICDPEYKRHASVRVSQVELGKSLWAD
jgi:hypothetical protein